MAGCTVHFASPGGVLQPLDEHSADPAVAGPDAPGCVELAQKALQEFGASRQPHNRLRQ